MLEMAGDPSNAPLPSGPSSLCFNKEDFMKDDFDVDKFVIDCRRRVQLETLRDDLHVYLKVLKSAMIELINKDYADFVNLSTNLVGMDRAIGNLSTPLSTFKDEVQVVKNSMEAAIQKVEEKLQKRRHIREKRALLQRLANIIQSVAKIEQLLGIQQSDEPEETVSDMYRTTELSGQLVERVATEFNKLQFYVNKSRGSRLVEEIKPRISAITTTLQYSLQDSLIHGLESGDIEKLRQCLRTYATIDKIKDAETLFRQHVVKDYMEDVIREQFINSNPNGLKGMYTKVLEFIPSQCKLLMQVTSGSPLGGEIVRGYDFLVNAVWPEIVANIEARTPSIFAPGNPNVFYEKYCSSMEFVEKLELNCGSQASVKRLRSHPAFTTFMSKWSLPVYFQIRFQEIAGSFESSLLNSFNKAKDSDFQLHSTQACWTALNHCWSSGVYIRPLCHRFWKLNLQILSRYSNWIEEVKDNELIKSKEVVGMRYSSSANDLIKSASTPNFTSGGRESPQTNGQIINSNENQPTVTMKQLVCLIADIQYLVYKMPSLLEQVIKPKLMEMGHKDMNLMEESLKEAQDAILSHLPAFGGYVVHELTHQCCGHLKNVTDIPRLFRRTNREIPSKPSNYLSNLVKPLDAFLGENNSVIPVHSKSDWTRRILQNITEQYLTVTTDVLTSVKKMEDSLKRLKRGKATASLTGMSDDDKIRQQLAIDVKHFGKQMEALELQSCDMDPYKHLMELVQNAAQTSVQS